MPEQEYDSRPPVAETTEDADWSEAAAVFEHLKTTTKTIRFVNYDGKGGTLAFGYGMLTQRQADRAQDSAVHLGRGDDMRTNSGGLKLSIFRDGVKWGPKGFDPKNTQHIATLPPKMRDKIVDAIEEFQKMDQETEVKFETFR